MRFETDFAENPALFQAEMNQLVLLGFPNEKKVLKLLYRTGGNVQVVASFLEAKKLMKESSMSTKCAKKLVKMEKKAKKLSKKGLKYSEKSSKCDEKLAKKMEKKLEKMNKKHGGEKHGKLSVDVSELTDQSTWPASVNHVFLDGNNMMYVANAMRKFAIKKKSMAEAILTSFARRFKEVANIKLTIIFDDASKTIEENRFCVFRARPAFATSDDALVQLAGALDDKKSAMFVTSDRELLQRLDEKGVILVKPKNWMAYAAERIREVTPTQFEGVENGLEAFLSHWIITYHSDETGTSNPEMAAILSKMTL